MEDSLMAAKATYKELEQEVKELRKEVRERKRAEKENKYRELADLLPQTVFEIDKKGNLTFANRHGFETSGYTQEDLSNGLNALKLFIPAHRDRVRKNIRKVLSGKKSPGNEYTALRKDGSTFPAIVYSSAIIRKGKSVGLRGILIDITERKQALAQMKEKEGALKAKKQELQEVNAALRVLLKGRDRDRAEFEEKVLSNVKELVTPYIGKLQKTRLDTRQATYVRILESNLSDIVSPFVRQLSSRYSALTPTEIQVAQLIREGQNTRQIAELLNSSKRTIESHRQSIRIKLGIKDTKANLRSHLSSI
jgi:PAS domain S-box-containing protein